MDHPTLCGAHSGTSAGTCGARRAIEIYMDDMKVFGPSGIRQALTYVVPQLNDTVSVAGYTPSQWLLGKMPRLPGGLAQDGLSPAHLGDHDQFEQLPRRH